MENGKRICQTLRDIRKRVAEANDIPFEIEECPHKGDCLGTCPKCEAEVSNLMDCLDQRAREGKSVVIDGVVTEEELRLAFSTDADGNGTPEEFEPIQAAGRPMLLAEELTAEIPYRPNRSRVIAGNIWGEPYRVAKSIANILLTNTSKNVVISPTGLCFMLELLRVGMVGNNFDDFLLEQHINLLLSDNKRHNHIETWDTDDFKLQHATSVWCNRVLGAVKKKYLFTLKESYNARVYTADFSRLEDTKASIDKWVSDNTNQMIQSLDTQISPDDLLVLLDAIYMKGKWEHPFDPDLTEKDTFYNADKTKSEVDMMNQEIEKARYTETKKYQAIELPYKNPFLSMVVVLPKKGVRIKRIMKTADWVNCFSLNNCTVDLYMPRFKFDNTLCCNDILRGLGLDCMLDRDDCFPGISDLPVRISQIKQQCIISVEEEGTEAAAITMAECKTSCPPPYDIPQTKTMRVNRPFGFAIKGRGDQVLFMGVVKNMNQDRD